MASAPLQQQWFRQALERCIAAPEEAFCLPPPCYSDAAIEFAEQDRLFRRHWIGLGRADQLKETGAFRTLEVAGSKLILLCDPAGRLRAFANSCRHRGTQLLEGEGRCRRITCPFHSWTYGLDGSLLAAPHMETTKNFDRAQFGLLELPLAVRAGFLFLHLGSKPGDLDEQLGDFAALHAPWPLESLVATRRRDLKVDCNWKAFLEVFNEYYHLRYVHPKTIDSLYQPPDPADQTCGSYASQFGETSGTGALLRDQQDHALPVMPGLEGRWSRGVRYTWLFPNMTFAAGREALWMYEAHPLGPARCRVTQTICFPPETIRRPGFEDRANAYYRRLDAALEEDIAVLERQQRGLASAHARAGPFAARLEPSVAAFAAWYARQLLEAPGPSQA